MKPIMGLPQVACCLIRENLPAGPIRASSVRLSTRRESRAPRRAPGHDTLADGDPKPDEESATVTGMAG